jgi:trigger factor
MKFVLKITSKKIADTYKHVLEETARSSQVKGFRKGKAPQKMVEEQIGEAKLLESVVEHVLPEAYSSEIKKRDLKPISYPKFTPKKMVKDQDWEFEVEIAQKPKIELGDYKKSVSEAIKKVDGDKAKDDIWVPGKDKQKAKQESKLDEDKRLRAVFDALLGTIKFEVPQLLIDEEVNRALSRLLNQVNKLGLTIDEYLKSMKLTSDKLKAEYAKTAEETLRLELILQEIGLDLKVMVEPSEVDAMIATVSDEKSRKALETPEEKYAIRAMLTKQKTVNKLMSV